MRSHEDPGVDRAAPRESSEPSSTELASTASASAEELGAATLPEGVLAVRRGPGANCSSIGSAVEMLFLSATIGATLLAAIVAALHADEPGDATGANGGGGDGPGASAPAPPRDEGDGGEAGA